MRGLGRGVHDQLDVGAMRSEEPIDSSPIADIEILMSVAVQVALVLLHRPLGGCFGTEEVGPHVVVDADDDVELRREIADRLGSDEPTGSGDECDLHEASAFLGCYARFPGRSSGPRRLASGRAGTDFRRRGYRR